MNFTRHFACEQKMRLSLALQTFLQLNESQIDEVIELGASYVGDSNKINTRLQEDVWLEAGQILRVHFPVKRYPSSLCDWQQQIVWQNDQFVVINKPAGAPAHATLDNALENTLTQLSQFLNVPLYITQRLDQPTQGLMVLAKTKEFQIYFNQLLREHRIEKKYKAIIPMKEKNILGPHRHYMRNSKFAPKELRDDLPDLPPQPLRPSQPPPTPWLHCDLEVESLTPITIENQPLQQAVIRLITGRPHQIRVQLSHLGYPILGDTMYGETSYKQLALQSFSLEFPKTLARSNEKPVDNYSFQIENFFA